MGQTCKISVVGNTRVECESDTLDLILIVERTEARAAIAQEKVNIIINKILAELKNIGIKSKDIFTTPMTIRDDYSYEDNKRVYKGIEVSQSVRCRLSELNKNTKKIINVIDYAGNSNDKIEFTQNFYLKDNSKSLELCRELAYKDAYKKGEHYAKFANTTIRGVSNISEYRDAEYSHRLALQECSMEMPDEDDKSTNFSIKKITTEMTLYVDFYAE